MPTDFRFGLGHVALDFIATLGSRKASPVERLGSADDLVRWFREAEVAEVAQVSREQLAQACALREAIYRVLDRALAGGRLPTREAATVNEWARRPTVAPQLGPAFSRFMEGSESVPAALAGIARESIELVTGPDLARVRTCAGCSLLFVDRSRPGQRRWCSMERCGNREKTARYRRSTSGGA